MANRFDLINLSNILQTSANGTVANVNFDSNTLFIDGVNNRVGIGTNAPAASLQTVGDVVIANNLSFNSGYGSAATAYGCRAWVNFNGTGTPAIRASGNVSSITDNGTGDYTINFTNAMPDVDYATVFGSAVSFNQTNGDQGWANLRSNNGGTNPQQTGSVRVWASSKESALGAAVDIVCINVAVFR